MIEARGLTKRYGDRAAVDGLSFTVRPGRVTGFLGPNGSGKTTTMRMILGVDRPTAGSVTVNGKPFAELYSAMREVGALLDVTAVHGGRSAHAHLLCLAQTNGIPRSRVDEVIGIVGLEDVAGKRSKGFSLGMSQRLGIAAALLGDPDVLMLTTFDLDEYAFAALRAGASGFLLKDAPRHDLIAAVKIAASGNALLAPSVTMRLIDAFARRPAQTLPTPSRLASLTAREHDILMRLARGLTNAEIAADLVVSEATVKSHVGNLLAKLGLRDRVQAVILAYETGIVRAGDPNQDEFRG